jgi:hypothetical protein
LALIAAFSISAIRLYHIGSQTFGHAINHSFSMQIAGISVVILSEASQIIFSLALTVFDTSRSGKRVLWVSMGMVTAMALVGNIQVAMPGQWDNLFAWIEAVVPPLIVLSLSYALKGQILESIRQRHENEQAYQVALEQWQESTSIPEQHPDWTRIYANSLRDALIAANRRRKSINLDELTAQDWSELVSYEMKAENWFVLPQSETNRIIQTANIEKSEDTENEVDVEVEEGNEGIVLNNPIPLARISKNRKREG